MLAIATGIAATLAAAPPAYTDTLAVAPLQSADTAAATHAADTAAGEFPYAIGGLYPLWEDTGTMLGHRHLALGLTSASVGVADRVELGFKPQTFILRVPNAFAKAALYSGHDVSVSVRLSALAVLAGAEKHFWSPTYTSTVPSNNRTLWALPLSGSATWQVQDSLRLHSSMTLMGVIGQGNVKSSVTPGTFVTAEFLALAGHSLFAHAGEIGVWDHNQWVLGGSYRFNYSWLELRLGYFYWWRKDGMQNGPLLNISVLQ